MPQTSARARERREQNLKPLPELVWNLVSLIYSQIFCCLYIIIYVNLQLHFIRKMID